jgi:hypothetical protein
MAQQPPATGAEELRTLRVFLEQGVPSPMEHVKAAVHRMASGYYTMDWPAISLYCRSTVCDGDRFFDPSDEHLTLGTLGDETLKLAFETYTCRHCQKTRKIYAVAIRARLDEKAHVEIKILKLGEDPPAIGPTPRALQSLLGDHWSLYLQGRRSELAGLGIGAFVYYRRAVEKIWQTVLARLIEVARLETSTDRIQALEAAQSEEKFTRSLEQAKGSIPASLYVDGHNPFQALYDACGDGLHEYSDEECIRRSQMIRLVLSRFSERVKSVLSLDAEFRTAVGALASKTNQEV